MTSQFNVSFLRTKNKRCFFKFIALCDFVNIFTSGVKLRPRIISSNLFSKGEICPLCMGKTYKRRWNNFLTNMMYTLSYKETGFPPAIWECVKSYSIGQPDRVMLFKPTITCYHGVFQPLSRVIAGFRAIESRVIIFSSASLVLGCFKHRYVRTHSPLPTLPWRSTFTPPTLLLVIDTVTHCTEWCRGCPAQLGTPSTYSVHWLWNWFYLSP